MNKKSKSRYYGLFDRPMNSFRAGYAGDNYLLLQSLSADFISGLIINEGYPEDIAALSEKEILDYYDFEIREVTKKGYEKIMDVPFYKTRVHLELREYK